MMVSRKHSRSRFLVEVLAGALAGFLLYWGWTQLQPPTSKVSAASGKVVERPPTRPDHIVDVRTGANGDYFFWRDSWMERYSAEGRRIWGPSPVERAPGARPFDAYSIAPDPNGDLYVIGIADDDSRHMLVYRVSGEKGRMALTGEFPRMAPADVAITAEGRVYLLAVRTPELNRALVQPDPKGVKIRADWIHELLPDGNLGRSFLTREYFLDSAEAANQAIQSFHDSRLVSSPDGTLYVYNVVEAWLERVDSASGASVGKTRLLVTGFAPRIRVSHLQFVTPEEIVYSVYESDEFGGAMGYQTHHADLATGETRLLERRIDNVETFETHYNPKLDRWMTFDIVDSGARPTRIAARQPLPGEAGRVLR